MDYQVCPTWYGKHGFNPPRIRIGYKPRLINITQLSELVDKLGRAGRLQYEGNTPVVDLASMGYHKLLGEGRIGIAVKVIVPKASREAVRKIEEAGGTVVLTAQEG